MIVSHTRTPTKEGKRTVKFQTNHETDKEIGDYLLSAIPPDQR